MNAEHQQLEWKASWQDDHLKWVCAFANSQGGTLVIGRDDSGQAVGLSQARKLLEDLPNKVRDLLGVVVQVNLRTEGGHEVLELVTPAYPTPISYRGRYYQRSGSTLQELKGAALGRFLLRGLRIGASTISIVELLRSDWTGGISAGVAWLVFLQVERRLPPEPTDTQS